MTGEDLRPHGTRPLIAVVCSVPLLAEAVSSALDFAEVRSFSERGGDVAGLLRWLRPDACVVDREDAAAEASGYAQEHELPVLRISPRDETLHLFRDGGWSPVGGGEHATPEAVRNVLAGVLFARGGAAR